MKKDEMLFQIGALVKEEWTPSPEKAGSASSGEKLPELEALEKVCAGCTKCGLYKTAKNLVFYDGNPDSSIVFIGEAPGADEDEQGKPFVGRAGKLLTKTIEKSHFSRGDVYICNILKHRPPENRNPLPDEIEACSPYLVLQLSIIKPKVIVTLGNFSTKFILSTDEGITKLRGNMMTSPAGYSVIPAYHPAAVLRNPNLQPDLENDIKKALMLI